MKKFVVSLLVSASAVSATVVNSQEMLPGQWQHSFQVKSESGQVEAALDKAKQMMASLPEAQRQMVEGMLKQQGVDLNLQNYTVATCVSETQAKNKELPKLRGNCSQEILEKTDNGFRISYSCPGNPPTTGEGVMTMSDSKHFQIVTTVNTQMQGQPEKMTITQKGEWLAAECN